MNRRLRLSGESDCRFAGERGVAHADLIHGRIEAGEELHVGVDGKGGKVAGRVERVDESKATVLKTANWVGVRVL